MLGLRGIVMNEPGDVLIGWREALAADRPVVVDARTDPEVPPLPPHVSFDQARSYMSALLKGDPHAGRTLRQSFRQIFPGLGS
jgi:pyruvate dehydrogenase (quinone)